MKDERRFCWVFKNFQIFLRMWMMSWPKLNNRWMTLFILTQMLKGSKRWQKHQKERKIVEIKGLDFKSFRFLKKLVLIQW